MNHKFNFTASFLYFRGVKIIDSLGHPITTIKYLDENLSNKYKPPTINFDILNPKKEEEKKPQIGKINMVELERLGFIFTSIPAKRGTGWFNKQKRIYLLYRKGSLEAQGCRRYKEFPRTGSVYAEHDVANNKIRLVGRSACRSGVGRWISVNGA